MNSNNNTLTVSLVGHYGRGNLGDDAMLEGIRRSFPDEHELRVMAHKQIPGVYTYIETPLQLLRAGFESDWIWMGGGSFIHDETKNRRFLHRGMLKAIAIFLTAKLTRCRLAFIGMGLGPIRHRWKQRIVRFLLARADYVSLRDRFSMEEWRRCADEEASHVHLTFDSCVALKPTDRGLAASSGPLTIGLNVLPYFRIYHDEPDRDGVLLDTVVQSCKQVLGERATRIRIFTYNVKEEESEGEMVAAAKDALSKFADTEIVPYQTPQNTIEDIRVCDAMVAMRYHGSMMGYVAGVPQIVLSYHEKCRALANEIGLPARSVLAVDSLQVETLAQKIHCLLENPDIFVAPRPLEDARRQFRATYFPMQFRS